MSCFKLTPDAKASLMQIAGYTQQKWGIRQRKTYLKMIDDCFHTLSARPRLGKIRPEIHHALRSHPAGKHIVFYIIDQHDIVIVHVLHQGMDPDILK
ncbi:MAG: type II toxin-antitoxin system RelE/ParE family toxin [Mariprofundus sp.]|nr:type II toxin-antitoxin system RelE/ParE family toxin [Mariprofundus sp.]